MQDFIVKSISSKQLSKSIRISRKGSTTDVKVHRYAPIGPDDEIQLSTSNSDRIYIKGQFGSIQIKPHFELYDKISLGSFVFEYRIKELITNEDFDNYLRLEKYHYRTNLSTKGEDEGEVDGRKTQNKKNGSGGGRKSVLILYLKLTNKWIEAGYIELQMPLLMCKPRHELFKNAYSNPSKQIKWEAWDQVSIRKYVNQIVRIGRVVTSPEYRGLGISRTLIMAAKKYSVERWHIKGKQPVFMEISAEMLKYIDFVSSSGFQLVGYTEGNLSRVFKDLKYMNNGYKISSGIMSLQKKYLTTFKNLALELDISFENAIKRLEDICTAPDPSEKLNELSISEYYLFKSVLRLPIPYYLMPLDDYSYEYMNNALPIKRIVKREIKPKNRRLMIADLNITASYNLKQSKYVKAIMSGFGLEGEFLNQPILQNMSFNAVGGNIMFISGTSGSGKSVLLNILNQDYDKNLNVTFKENNSEQFKVSYLKPIQSDLPIIEYFSQRHGIEMSLSALNRAGLSEAFVYLKPYSMLSRGQQYRARFAELILDDSDIWLLDEFCSDLDVITANVVSNNLRKLILRYSKIAIVAAANHEHFIETLRPTRIIALSVGRNPRFLSLNDYRDELFSR